MDSGQYHFLRFFIWLFFDMIVCDMKKITLAALGARFSHSSLALLCLKHAAFDKQAVTTKEYNINDSVMDIAADIIAGQPDAVGFSCYIWNIEHVVKIASVVKSVLPRCLIVLGGPEVSFDCDELLSRWPFADVIICGPGEAPFAHLTKCLAEGQSIAAMPSAYIRTPEGVIRTPKAEPCKLADQPFLYDNLSAFDNKMIYYETSRGCPFRCAYCMSAGEALDFMPVERVKTDLEFFLRADVQQVKLVDRTFNHPDVRAREIWAALIAIKEKYPHSRTNFHFEVSASLLSEETIRLLAAAPQGLIQLEIGIQSTHDDTLSAVNRAHDTGKLLRNTAVLCGLKNLRVYVDLIAGLPMETMATVARSFDDAYQLCPDKLQLGFLKLLRGSHMRKDADKYGIVYTRHAPYEVLKTDTTNYAELRHLHRVEQVLDMLYNEKQALKTLALLIPLYGSPFAFFDGFTHHLEDAGYFDRPQKKQAVFEQLLCFAAPQTDKERLVEALGYDWLCLGKPGGWPDEICIPTRSLRDLPEGLPQDMSWRDAGRRYVLAAFSRLLEEPAWLLFDYAKPRDDDEYVKIIKTLP